MEDREHGRLGLADARRRDQEKMLALQYVRDGLALRASRLMDVLFLQYFADTFIQELEYHRKRSEIEKLKVLQPIE
jgi:hypothetical protein